MKCRLMKFCKNNPRNRFNKEFFIYIKLRCWGNTWRVIDKAEKPIEFTSLIYIFDSNTQNYETKSIFSVN